VSTDCPVARRRTLTSSGGQSNIYHKSATTSLRMIIRASLEFGMYTLVDMADSYTESGTSPIAGTYFTHMHHVSIGQFNVVRVGRVASASGTVTSTAFLCSRCI
jgi:hypothetical protein